MAAKAAGVEPVSAVSTARRAPGATSPLAGDLDVAGNLELRLGATARHASVGTSSLNRIASSSRLVLPTPP
jgi:hypothetical protein